MSVAHRVSCTDQLTRLEKLLNVRVNGSEKDPFAHAAKARSPLSVMDGHDLPIVAVARRAARPSVCASGVLDASFVTHNRGNAIGAYGEFHRHTLGMTQDVHGCSSRGWIE